MKRWIDLLLSDWPLKLGAIGLALVLYAGVTLSDNDRSWPGDVPIEILDPPQGGAVLDLPGSVTNVRYRAPIEAAVALANGSFTASVDLGHVTPEAGAAPVTVPVRVTALDPRVQVIDFTPRSVSLRVDQVISRPMTITVDRGAAPPGLALGPPVVTPSTAILRGASSRVAAVQSVVARVAVDASGLNVEQDVDLEAIDDTGAPVPGVEILPQGVHVSIEVARELGYVTLPVVPTLSGQVAPGYRLASVVVQPTTLTVSGEVAAVSALTSVGTEPIDLAGSSETIQGLTPVRLPEDVTTVGGVQEVLVTLVIEADEGSRSFEAGIRLDGARRTRTYTLSTPSVLVTLAGPLPTLDALDPATIVAVVDVAGLGSGTHEVEVTVEAIEGLQASSVAPASIRVQVAPAPTAPPSTEPTDAPSDEPTAQPASEPAPTAPIDSDRPLPGILAGGTVTRLFGTDGIRGVANVDLKPTLAYALGRATASQLLAGRGPLLVGQDTRRSGDMLVAALVAGATSMGADVHRLGICPTPALSFVTGELDYAAGIMVSASHNPADDNGLKVLDAAGMKLDERAEDALEALLWRADELPSPTNAELGRDIDARAGLDRYRAHRLGLAARAAGDVRVVLDCANGSAGPVAPDILAATGASVSVHFAEPDGVNINHGCGATVPGALAAIVATEGADVGFALDGDADRCVAVDERGQVVDGDQLLGIVALDRLARGALSASTLVVSVLSNGGLAAVVERAGGRVQRTRVGDKYILDAMLVSGAGVGGEKSGHVIIREHSTSGDGIVTALEVLSIMGRTGRRLSELAAEVPLFPQQQRAIPVRYKDQWEADQVLVAAVAAAEAELSGQGRVLVRPSGTEPALRIMVEGEDAARVLELAEALATLAADRLNQPA